MSRTLRALSLGFAILLLSHCSGGSSSKKGNNEINPSTSTPISTYFGVPTSEDGTKSNLITIQKSALGQEFLLQGSLAEQQYYGTQIENPKSRNAKSHIVSFQEQENTLLMLDVTQGHQPGKEIPAHLLLASFPIKKNEKTSITFDFNEGMKNLLLNSDWYSSDYGKSIEPNFVFSIDSSYLRDTKIGASAMTIVQTVAARYLDALLPFEMTYYISPYKQNSNYIPVDSPGFNYLGYFESNPIVEESFGTPFTYITRFDISKPVIYYLSSAIPKEYRDTVREGVLYWNKVFGKEVLQVADAPEGMTAPDFEHNIIQWHTDHYDGGIADAQMDPRTGEILHAQIFIASGWTTPVLLHNLPKFERKIAPKIISPKTSANFFEETPLCQLQFSDIAGELYQYRDVLEKLPDERLQTMTKDILRRVISHEVGHTLGLRHNFAGSLYNVWDGDTEEKIIREYLSSGKLPDKLEPIFSSVMDYGGFIPRILLGSYINQPETKPLPYDLYAIQWGYFNFKQLPKYEEGITFCTDSQVGVFADCERQDSGKHLIERTVFNANRSLEKIPWLASETYLDAKVGFDPKSRNPVEESTPSTEYLSSSVMQSFEKLLDLLSGETTLVSILRKHPDATDIDRNEIDFDHLDWLNKEIKNAGGIKNVLKIIDPGWFQKSTAEFLTQFKIIVTSETFLKINFPEGGEGEFNKSEISYILKRADELFPATEEKLVLHITSALAKANYAPFDSIEEVEQALAHWADYVINAGGAKDFRYSFSTRAQAVKLLVKSQGPLPDWLAQYVPAIAEKLRLKLEAVYGKPIGQIDPRTFPRKDQDGVEAELSLYQALAGGLQK
ncbi:MAG: zinc-dependent metalloprotease [Deltaproteobacteria bacterium]|nr:zinc-dependent metalloprotease [Deltaproteobacteria bacterium]